jgi:uncharacterized protein YoxC
MVFVNIAAIVVAAAVVVLVFFFVSLIRELKTTAISLREIASRMESDILPTVKELHEVLTEVSMITEGAAEGMDSVKSLMSAVGETGRGLGASHQTGWTALVIRSIKDLARRRAAGCG